MRRLYIKFLYLSTLCAIAASCDSTIHEYPDTETSTVTLNMSIDTAAPQIYRVVEYSSGTAKIYAADEWMNRIQASGVMALDRSVLESRDIDASKWDMHLVWELYDGNINAVKNGKARLVERRSQLLSANDPLPGHSYNVDIPAGDYTLLAWADYVPSGTNGDYYYDTTDMKNITSDLALRADCSNNDQRDCFTKMYEFTVSGINYAREGRSYSTTLTRPQGRYILLAADYEEYKGLTDTPITDFRVSLTYPSFVNVGYTVAEERPNESETGLKYSFMPVQYVFDGEETACLADDYSFVNGEVSYVQLNADIKHMSGRGLSSARGIEIPLYANRLTVVIGKFLTSDKNSGGLEINDLFDGEIRIEY